MTFKVIKLVSLILILCNCINLITSAPKCDRVPEGTVAPRSPPDGRFRLRITNDPQYYIKGETYNSNSFIFHIIRKKENY